MKIWKVALRGVTPGTPRASSTERMGMPVDRRPTVVQADQAGLNNLRTIEDPMIADATPPHMALVF
jgi:hypothetical protein